LFIQLLYRSRLLTPDATPVRSESLTLGLLPALKHQNTAGALIMRARRRVVDAASVVPVVWPQSCLSPESAPFGARSILQGQVAETVSEGVERIGVGVPLFDKFLVERFAVFGEQVDQPPPVVILRLGADFDAHGLPFDSAPSEVGGLPGVALNRPGRMDALRGIHTDEPGPPPALQNDGIAIYDALDSVPLGRQSWKEGGGAKEGCADQRKKNCPPPTAEVDSLRKRVWLGPVHGPDST
jgi:hypothetical protein